MACPDCMYRSRLLNELLTPTLPVVMVSSDAGQHALSPCVAITPTGKWLLSALLESACLCLVHSKHTG